MFSLFGHRIVGKNGLLRKEKLRSYCKEKKRNKTEKSYFDELWYFNFF
jgi:hypothetical protein